MIHLSELSIRKPVFAWMLMAATIVFGAISFNRLGISQLPDVDFPVVSVSVRLNGAAPEIMETQVIDPIEDSIMQIDGIRNITSTAQQASGSISVEFELNQNINTAMQQIQNRIQQVKNVLPTDLFPPVLRKINPEDQPILWVTVTTDDAHTSLKDMMMFARDYLFDELSSVPGVGNVVLGGYVDPALRIWADQDKMTPLNLSSDDILKAIQSEHTELPSGILENSKNEYKLRIKSEATSPAEFGKINIGTRNGLGANFRPLQLKNIAYIEEGLQDVRRMSRFNGKTAVGLGILKQHGSNAVEVSQNIRKRIQNIQSFIPKSYKVEVRSDNTRFIKQSVDELIFTLILSALLTSLVCYLFLGSWTSTINVLLSIPTSIIGTFVVFYFSNFTLNTFTLLGLSLAIGLVVDDAIMMLENIVRHQELGEKRRKAAILGSKEITFAALAATIAVVAIFAPVIFMKGVIGRYFYQYGVTVSAAVLLSLLEALTLTPMRCSRFLNVHEETSRISKFMEHFFKKLASLYRGTLNFLLTHRWKTICSALLFFILSFIVAKNLSSEMMPAQDQAMILLRFKMPVGTAIGITNDKMKKAESYLLKQPEIIGVYSSVGGFGGDAVNQGFAFVTLSDKNKRKLSQAALMQKIRKAIKKEIPEMETIVQDLSLRGFAVSRGFPIEFIVQGPDWNKLTDYTQQIIDKLKQSNILTDVNTDVQPGMPEVQLTPNRKKLAQYGVSLSSVTAALNTLVGGAILQKESQYSMHDHRYAIELRLISSQRDKIPDIDAIHLRNNRGELVKLSKLVDRQVKPSLMLISRQNRARAIKVYANPITGHSQQEGLKFAEKIAKSVLPTGYYYQITGSSESFKESFQSLIFAMLLGILVSYMVLASQFNSFVHPIIVLLALPFSMSGAFIGLALGNQSINIYSLIGFILLMGIVKKNSILLVDFTNQLRKQGMDTQSALLEACPIRLRPILMTSIATIAAAIPEAISLGPGAETTIPMAIAIIGGVIASTILTLFVIPCAYSLIPSTVTEELETIP